MSARYIVELSKQERDRITVILDTGKHAAITLKRANILRLADNNRHEDAFIVEATNTSLSTVHRVRQRFVEGALEHALYDKRRPGGRRKLTPKQEAILVARACSKPPKGAARWTLKLLADDLVSLTDVETISSETIRRRLKEKVLKPWQEDMWCIPRFDARFVAQMEDILDLYAQPADPSRPVVNFDFWKRMA